MMRGPTVEVPIPVESTVFGVSTKQSQLSVLPARILRYAWRRTYSRCQKACCCGRQSTTRTLAGLLGSKRIGTSYVVETSVGNG